jgi:aspartate kinase
VNIEMISTSAIRISCVVDETDIELAVQTLHTAFGLDGDVAEPSRTGIS